MNWIVILHDDFEPEYEALSPEVQDALILEGLMGASVRGWPADPGKPFRD
jgi:hypothetical protein